MSLFKLEKLTVEAFDTVDRKPPASKTFKASYNPTSYQQHYGLAWSCRQAINASSQESVYIRSDPSELRFELLLDGTGVDTMGLLGLTRKTVDQQLALFEETVYAYDGEKHRPNFLVVSWGKLWFSCRLDTYDVKVELFQRDGTPLRATLDVCFVADEDDQKRNRRENKSSPDLTHSRTVRAGDTLPLLTQRIYGTSKHYLEVARFNALDHFRQLEPGRQLLFPPLDTLLRGDAMLRDAVLPETGPGALERAR